MRHYLIGSVFILAACSPQIETRIVIPEVGADLRTPCTVTPREALTLADVGLLLTDHVEALDCANGKITAIDLILTDAETKEKVQ